MIGPVQIIHIIATLISEEIPSFTFDCKTSTIYSKMTLKIGLKRLFYYLLSFNLKKAIMPMQ